VTHHYIGYRSAAWKQSPMADLDHLLASFESGDLERPDAARPNFLDLVRAIAAVAGVPDLELTPNGEAIRDRISGPDHLVFVLVDGLGADVLERTLSPDSWLRRHVVHTIQSVYPPTTGAAITSVATGEWPAVHGVVGWWTYLSRLAGTACILPFVRHRDGAPLVDCGIEPAHTFPPSLTSRMTRDTAVAQPSAIIDSVYSTWFGNGAATIPYQNHTAAVLAIAARIRAATRPTHTYWYTPIVDREAHEHGTGSARTRTAVLDVDRALQRLAAELAGRDARIVVTADHGHRDVGQRFPIERDDPLCDFLRTPPSGDMRVAFYHLQNGARRAFTSEFQARFGEHFALITTDQLEQLRLLGPIPLAAETRARVGDCASVALDASVMRYTGGFDGDHFMHQRSHHSGLSPAEMTIPLIIA
jgi:hypothetical protein